MLKRGGQGGPPSRPRSRIDTAILDSFSQENLRTWERGSKLLRDFRVKQYYHLEGLREIHKTDIESAIKNQNPIEIQVENWARIFDWQYSAEPLSAQGSYLQGGRFNIGASLNSSAFPPFPALYIAEDNETAYLEKFGALKSSGEKLEASELALRKPNSYTSIRLNGDLSELFDLRSPDSLDEFSKVIGKFSLTHELIIMARELKLKPPYLLSSSDKIFEGLMGSWQEWEAMLDLPSNSQIFAKIIKDCGFEGIVYRSTKSKGDCITLFLENFDNSPSYIEILDPAPAASVITKLDSDTWDQLYNR